MNEVRLKKAVSLKTLKLPFYACTHTPTQRHSTHATEMKEKVTHVGRRTEQFRARAESMKDWDTQNGWEQPCSSHQDLRKTNKKPTLHKRETIQNAWVVCRRPQRHARDRWWKGCKKNGSASARSSSSDCEIKNAIEKNLYEPAREAIARRCGRLEPTAAEKLHTAGESLFTRNSLAAHQMLVKATKAVFQMALKGKLCQFFMDSDLAEIWQSILTSFRKLLAKTFIEIIIFSLIHQVFILWHSHKFYRQLPTVNTGKCLLSPLVSVDI